MRALIQRVRQASVSVDGEEVAAIGSGLLCFLGVLEGDTQVEAKRLAEKTLGLRVFPDAHRPMNRSLMDVGGEILVVSQFTLAADTSRGMRPSFTRAAAPDEAERLYKRYAELLESADVSVARGIFGAHMLVAIENDGPVTILLEVTP